MVTRKMRRRENRETSLRRKEETNSTGEHYSHYDEANISGAIFLKIFNYDIQKKVTKCVHHAQLLIPLILQTCGGVRNDGKSSKDL